MQSWACNHENFDCTCSDNNRYDWLNIQSFQLNFASFRENAAVKLHNELLHLSAYLPAIAASSPIFEGKFGQNIWVAEKIA